METQKLVNKYLQALGEQLKTAIMEKTMALAQLSVAQEELEEERKKLKELEEKYNRLLNTMPTP
jgi:tRNA(Phe) wybutosine-synthesizing methylase Tyw3